MHQPVIFVTLTLTKRKKAEFTAFFLTQLTDIKFDYRIYLAEITDQIIRECSLSRPFSSISSNHQIFNRVSFSNLIAGL